jgi:hypothetical protein
MTSAAQTSPQRLTAAEAYLIGATFVAANGPWHARRRERDERAFLFDSDLNLIAEFEREDWEWALSSGGGDPVRAARQCGLTDVPAGAKALWGRSADEAKSTYRRWQRRR